MPGTKNKLHYFGADEEEYFHRVADQRTKLLRPLAMFFVRRNVRSDTLTLASFLLLPFFFFPLFGLRYYLLAWLVLILHIVIDGLDGPVARLGRYASDKGALSDILNDITGMVVVALTAIYFDYASPSLGALYVASYIYMIIFIIARNVLEMPFRFVFKSKYYLYIFLLIKVHFGWNILDPFLLLLSIYQTVMAVIGFVHLRRHLPGVLGRGARGAWPATDKVASRERRRARRAHWSERHRRLWERLKR